MKMKTNWTKAVADPVTGGKGVHLRWPSFYQPQRSCGQGNVFTPICDSVNRGGAIPACIAGGIPACLAADLLGVVLSQHALQWEVPAPGGA